MKTTKKKFYLILATVSVASAYGIKNAADRGLFTSSVNPVATNTPNENKVINRAPAAVAGVPEVVPEPAIVETKTEAPALSKADIVLPKVVEEIEDRVIPPKKIIKEVPLKVEADPVVHLPPNPPIEMIPEAGKTFSKSEEVKEEVKAQPNIIPILEEKKLFNQSELTFKLSERYIKIAGYDNSTHTTGSLFSPSLVGGEIKWKQFWTEDFNSFIAAEFLKVSIDPSATKTILDRKANLAGFSIGVEKHFTTRFSGGISFGKNDELVYRATDADTLKIDKVSATRASLTGKVQVAKAQKLSLDLSASYLVIFPFKNDYYTSKSGSGYKTALELNHHEEKYDVKADLFYSQYKLPVGVVNYTRTDLGIGIGFSWSFDK